MDRDFVKILAVIIGLFVFLAITIIVLVNYDIAIEKILIRDWSCAQLMEYIVNNEDSGYVARWKYNDMCK